MSNGLWFSWIFFFVLKKSDFDCWIFVLIVHLLVSVTTVDSGSKALEFLGWHKDERSNSNETSVSRKSHQVTLCSSFSSDVFSSSSSS